MGYSCPVCDDPQADAVHLANHLAFTALSRGGDHEAWLDEHVPEWESMDENQLADQVEDNADEMEFPQVFEDTTNQHGNRPDHEHRDSAEPTDNSETTLPPTADLDGELSDEDVDSVIEEAVEMTRSRRGDESESE